MLAAQRRSFAGDVEFAEALTAAARALRHDRTDSESAASMLARYGDGYLAHPNSVLSLARTGHITPRGDTVSAAWIFTLVMPALSDHVYWIVIQRRRDARGRLVVASYGFN